MCSSACKSTFAANLLRPCCWRCRYPPACPPALLCPCPAEWTLSNATGAPAGLIVVDSGSPQAISVAAPDPSHDVEWMGLPVVSTQGLAAGSFPSIDYLIRTNTSGGQVPAQCAVAGQQLQVPFMAQYNFYNCMVS